MLSSMSRSFALAVAAILGAGYSVTSMVNQPAMTSSAPRPVTVSKRAVFGGRSSLGRYGRKGAGITMARQQRTAAKKRGVSRNRQHHR